MCLTGGRDDATERRRPSRLHGGRRRVSDPVARACRHQRADDCVRQRLLAKNTTTPCGSNPQPTTPVGSNPQPLWDQTHNPCGIKPTTPVGSNPQPLWEQTHNPCGNKPLQTHNPCGNVLFFQFGTELFSTELLYGFKIFILIY